ncbi:hypothetical protein DV736_g192, partial [Chaetothyriales sp. CBS 134916]
MTRTSTALYASDRVAAPLGRDQASAGKRPPPSAILSHTMGKLVRLELFNFKSYKGHHTLLFGDAYFTSIIGPNGSGKSNSMDAISFVLGIKSSHLRSTHLKELIYRGRVLRKSIATADKFDAKGANGDAYGDEVDGSQANGSQSERNDPKSAWVMAVYEDDAGMEQKWRRSITSQGVSEYRINERVVTAAQYNEALEDENILIKARNFLVFQGDVEAIAVQKPQDLTKLIEQVSGSIEYKAGYDRLKDESEAAAEVQTSQLQRRRAINAEIRQYQEQKREADRFTAKANERDEAIVTYSMWKLYHLQQTIDQSSAEIQKLQDELKEFNRGIEKYTKALDSAKKAYSTVQGRVSKADKAIKLKEREIDNKEGSLLPIDEQISASNKQLSRYQSRIDSIDKERVSHSDTVKHLEKDLKVVEKARGLWQAEWDASSNKQGGQLSSADLQQYTKLREEVNKRAGADQSRISGLKNDRAPLEATLNSLKATVDSGEYKLQSVESEYSNISDRKTTVAETMQLIQADMDTKKKELNAATSRRLQMERNKTELNEKLQSVLHKLIEADNGRQASYKELRMRETVAALKRTYPGVKGRIHELCKPKQKKYEEAVSVVLGMKFDSIVVDTEQTARACIEYLRDHRAGQAEFIPLDAIQVKAVSPSFRSMHKGMRPAIDTVDYSADVSRAIQYACSNSIICDTLAIAKEMRYGRKLDVKAATLDGSIIHKAGLMTGGRGREDNKRRWDDADVDKLNKLRENLQADLAALPQERSSIAEEQNLSHELRALESRLREVREELSALDKNLNSKKKEVDHVKQELKQNRSKLKAEEHKVQSIDQDISHYSDAVRNVENQVFSAFCQQHGFDDIHDYEARQGTLQQEALKKKLEFAQQKARLESQLAFEKKRLETTEMRIVSLQEKEARDRQSIDELNEQKAGIEDDLATLRDELDELNAKLEQEQEQLVTVNETLNKAKAQVDKRQKSSESTISELGGAEASYVRHVEERTRHLRKCKIENINIPLTSGSATLDSLPMIAEEAETEAMEIDDDDGNGPSSSALQTAANHGIHPDFDNALTDELREQDSSQMEKELLDNIAKLTSALDKMQPNSHAAARLATVEQRFRDTEQEFEDARKLYRTKKQEFESVQAKRNDLFNKAFTHISDQIEPIYADLTRSAEFTAGGRAYLTADDSEPYLQGVMYHTMPPAKRFRDMEHLSGGEKTMAALALLFAIHSYQPSPFFVLDEVDAALDNANVSRLVRYVRNHAHPGMQFIVISLKTGFFQGSQALVGIYRDQAVNSSKVLTLDLRKYHQ